MLPLIVALAASWVFSPASARFTHKAFSPRQVASDLPSTAGGQCSSGQPTIPAPHANVWQSLTTEELNSAYDFLLGRSGLNLTDDEDSPLGNSIANLELLQPNKTDVLAFLDSNAPPPSRYARATIMFRGTADPYVQDYMIGPLPVINATKVEPLTFLYNNAEPGKLRMLNSDNEARDNFTNNIMSSISDVQKKLFNATLDDTISLQSTQWEEQGRIISWYGFTNDATSDFDVGTLLPLGLFVGFDMTGPDPSKWTLTGWFYNGKFYKTTEEFREAAMRPDFEIVGLNVDGPWAHTDRQGDAMRFDDLPPPVPVSRGPNRFSIDAKENFVSWMDFNFYISHSRDTGLRLWDIKYKGKRILYELGLEEAIAHYAGFDPIQSGTTYFDSLPGFGPALVSLIDGYDCPSYSTYLNVTMGAGKESTSQPNAVCLFEFDTGHPIQRHSAFGYASVTKNIAFTLRSVSTIGNYDYATSYSFFLDGTMEVSVRASGYIQSAFFAHNEEYGFKIHDFLSGSMHTHVLTFKADFDILGQKNSLQKVEITPATVQYPWSNGSERNTMKVVKSFIESEDDSQLDWTPNSQAMYAVVNKDAKNRFGENPGYRFMLSSGSPVHLAINNSSNTKNAARYAEHHFYATKQKDTEAQAAHSYNSMNPAEPLIDFAKFFDGESLDQEDLVIWFNLGMHHVPHTGDLPNTVFSTAHSAMTIEPLNYLEGDPSRATVQQIRVVTNDDRNNTSVSVKTFGAKESNCSVDTSELVPDLSAYSGYIAVRGELTGPDAVSNKRSGIKPSRTT